MANRRMQNGGGRRMDYGRNDRNKGMNRPGVSPWQGGGGPGGGIPNLLPMAGGHTEATLALANNLITNLLQTRQQSTVPSLLDMPIRRDFGPDMGRFDHGGGYGMNRMGNQGNFRRYGNYNRPNDRMNANRKPFRPNDGPRRPNRTISKREGDSKPRPVKESEQQEKKKEEPKSAKTENGEEEKNGTDAKETPKTRYDDIYPSMLKCHICNKSMWDGRSFENHLSGRAHAIMMQKTSESYALTADTMRQEFKIREMKRTRKSGQHTPRDFYCAMCDMYAADGAVHRTTGGHRKLKKYLHPACTSCHKEMPTRIELDEHRLTPEHLKNEQDRQTTTKKKPEVMVISTLSMEMSYVRDDRSRKRTYDNEQKDSADKNQDGDDEEKADGDAEQQDKDETEVKNEVEEDVKMEAAQDENFIVDVKEGDDLTNVTLDMLPQYNTTRGVGNSFLSEFHCIQCSLCHKLLDSQETADVHLRTWRHHQLFIRHVKDKAGLQNDGNKRALNSTSDEQNDNDCKRRKTDGGEAREGDEAQAEDENNDQEEIGDLSQDENWEQTVDEILKDELLSTPNNDEAEPDQEFQQEQEPEPEPEEEEQMEKELSPPPVKRNEPRTRASPRGRGRGRRRN